MLLRVTVCASLGIEMAALSVAVIVTDLLNLAGQGFVQKPGGVVIHHLG